MLVNPCGIDVLGIHDIRYKYYPIVRTVVKFKPFIFIYL